MTITSVIFSDTFNGEFTTNTNQSNQEKVILNSFESNFYVSFDNTYPKLNISNGNITFKSNNTTLENLTVNSTDQSADNDGYTYITYNISFNWEGKNKKEESGYIEYDPDTNKTNFSYTSYNNDTKTGYIESLKDNNGEIYYKFIKSNGATNFIYAYYPNYDKEPNTITGFNNSTATSSETKIFGLMGISEGDYYRTKNVSLINLALGIYDFEYD